MVNYYTPEDIQDLCGDFVEVTFNNKDFYPYTITARGVLVRTNAVDPLGEGCGYTVLIQECPNGKLFCDKYWFRYLDIISIRRGLKDLTEISIDAKTTSIHTAEASKLTASPTPKLMFVLPNSNEVTTDFVIVNKWLKDGEIPRVYSQGKKMGVFYPVHLIDDRNLSMYPEKIIYKEIPYGVYLGRKEEDYYNKEN